MEDNGFRDRVVAITGSARGIGKNIARAFGLAGAHIVICDIDKKPGQATRDELCRREIDATFLFSDLSRKRAPQKMVRQIAQKFGRLDILINNAGAGKKRPWMKEDEESWEEGISVTLRAAFFASQEAIRVMSKQGGGSIINISSVAAFLTCHQSPVYHIAKAGLLQMTRYLASQAGSYGVRINTVSAGFIVRDEDRDHYERSTNRRYRKIAEFCHPLRRVGTSDDVANAVMFLCSPKASFISGQSLIVDGGLVLQEQSGLVFRFAGKRKKRI